MWDEQMAQLDEKIVALTPNKSEKTPLDILASFRDGPVHFHACLKPTPMRASPDARGPTKRVRLFVRQPAQSDGQTLEQRAKRKASIVSAG